MTHFSDWLGTPSGYLLRNRLSFGGNGGSYAVSRQAQPSRENILGNLRAA